jgi:hypothetical protein
MILSPHISRLHFLTCAFTLTFKPLQELTYCLQTPALKACQVLADNRIKDQQSHGRRLCFIHTLGTENNSGQP